jgi:hypothetical protein
MLTIDQHREDALFMLDHTKQNLDRFDQRSWTSQAIVTAQALAGDPLARELMRAVNYGPRDYLLLKAGRYHNARPLPPL